MINYSFIIPHHNCPNLLNRCVGSIPEREDIQIIVVDDNSDIDKKPKIKRSGVELYVIEAQETKGAGHARNIGLSKAVGKWVLFADADDYYTEKLLPEIDKYSNDDIDVLYFNYTRIELDSKTMDDNKLQYSIDKYNGDKEIIDFIKFSNNSPCTKMIRFSYIKSHSMFYEEVPNGNDVLFSLFVGSYTEKIAVSKERLYTYINNPNSIGTKKQTDDEILCRWIHRVQHNYFNNYIGYPQWNVSISKFLLKFLKQTGLFRGVRLLFIFVWQFKKNRALKSMWVDLIEKHSLCKS